MAWVEPKTDWVDDDYFNLDPDYNRIKGNIEHLVALAQSVYNPWENTELETATIDGYPTVTFFNKVIAATNEILDKYRPSSAQEMRTYLANGTAWQAADLNNIENNHWLLYRVLTAQEQSIPKLSMTLGEVNYVR